jgi:hypothetical protein
MKSLILSDKTMIQKFENITSMVGIGGGVFIKDFLYLIRIILCTYKNLLPYEKML